VPDYDVDHHGPYLCQGGINHCHYRRRAYNLMPSVYLDSSEYDAFGLTSTVTDGQVMRASALIDAYLKRPLGLAYLMDRDGVPCAMQGGSPRMTYTLGALSPGSNVTVAITPANATQDLIGEVLIVEVDSVNIEALVVTAVPSAGQLTFKAVKYSHANGTRASLGFVITEEKSLPGRRSVVRSMQHPFVTMLSCLGRYGYGRRSDQAAGTWGDVNLLAMVQSRRRTSGMVADRGRELRLQRTDRRGLDTGWRPDGLLQRCTDALHRWLSGHRHSGCDQGRDGNSRQCDRQHQDQW
jgi:hypothetical protein